ncbi:MAG: hypothetical protein H0T92_10650 [Pyrinomonadaceae bacterium]|nr:hypothetical protein [Pyrinomonadaceae bacterium]
MHRDICGEPLSAILIFDPGSARRKTVAERLCFCKGNSTLRLVRDGEQVKQTAGILTSQRGKATAQIQASKH